MQLEKGSSCEEKWVTEREHAAVAYLLLLDPSKSKGDTGE